jgi:hypothetical protein
MILEFDEKQYVDIDAVVALRWLKDMGKGVIAFRGADKIVVNDPDQFDRIEQAFIWLHKSHIVNDKLEKVTFVKRGKE